MDVKKINRLENRQDEFVIDLRVIGNIIREKWKLMMLCGLIGSLILGGLAYFSKDHKFITNAIVSIRDTVPMKGELSYSQEMIVFERKLNTYRAVVASMEVKGGVLSDLVSQGLIKQNELPYKDLEKHLRISIPENAEVVQITANYTDEKVAFALADTAVARVTKALGEVSDSKDFTVIQKPGKPYDDLKSGLKNKVVVGFMLGSILAGAWFSLRWIINPFIRNKDDLDALGLNVIGTISIKSSL